MAVIRADRPERRYQLARAGRRRHPCWVAYEYVVCSRQTRHEFTMNSYTATTEAATSVVFHSVVDLFRARRARPTFSMIDSAVAVQMYGIGFSLC